MDACKGQNVIFPSCRRSLARKRQVDLDVVGVPSKQKSILPVRYQKILVLLKRGLGKINLLFLLISSFFSIFSELYLNLCPLSLSIGNLILLARVKSEEIGCMSNLKILLAGRPQAMRQLVRTIIAQPDMEIVGSYLDPMEVLLTAVRREADVVIISLNNSEEPGLVSHLFAELPDVTVLMLSSTGDAAYVVQRCPWRRELFDISEDYIVRVLRRLTKEPCSPIDDLDEQWPP